MISSSVPADGVEDGDEHLGRLVQQLGVLDCGLHRIPRAPGRRRRRRKRHPPRVHGLCRDGSDQRDPSRPQLARAPSAACRRRSPLRRRGRSLTFSARGTGRRPFQLFGVPSRLDGEPSPVSRARAYIALDLHGDVIVRRSHQCLQRRATCGVDVADLDTRPFLQRDRSMRRVRVHDVIPRRRYGAGLERLDADACWRRSSTAIAICSSHSVA